MTRPQTAPKRLSPLYTSKDAELAKREVLKRLGKDLDGAYRVTNRKDKPV